MAHKVGRKTHSERAPFGEEWICRNNHATGALFLFAMRDMCATRERPVEAV
jgi:hypothetical protein